MISHWYIRSTLRPSHKQGQIDGRIDRVGMAEGAVAKNRHGKVDGLPTDHLTVPCSEVLSGKHVSRKCKRSNITETISINLLSVCPIPFRLVLNKN